MGELIWNNILSGALNWAFGLPWYVWAVPAAVLIGIAVKLYETAGWKGILGAVMLIITVGAYRQGWNDASQRRGPNSFKPQKENVVRNTIDKVLKRQPTTGKRRYNRDTNEWEPIDGGN
jgi:hypothetical protein